MIKSLHISSAIFIIFSIVSCSGKYNIPKNIPTSPIAYVTMDTIHEFEVSKKIKPISTGTKNMSNYYFFYNQSLKSAKGSYMGSLLHGTYVKYLRSNQMIEKGQFDGGLKDGHWLKWGSDGVLLENTEYNKGVVEQIVEYHRNGQPKSRSSYKAGVINGKNQLYDDKGRPTGVIYYNNGIKDEEKTQLKNLTKEERIRIKEEVKKLEKERKNNQTEENLELGKKEKKKNIEGGKKKEKKKKNNKERQPK